MTNVELLIEGGTVVNADGRRAATVLVGGGRILALVDPREEILGITEATRRIDATGKLVLPGGVDPHCHVATALGEFTTTDDYARTTTAALHGGTTTIVDFAIPGDDQTPTDAVLERTEMAASARCSVALHGCVRRWDATTADQLRNLADDGVTTVKLFTTYRGLMMVSPDDVLSVMEIMSEVGGLTYVHAESNHIIEHVQTERAAEGRIGSADHALSRPEISERAAVAEVLATAEAVGAAVYFVHQTTPEVVDMVAAARLRGVRAFTETCTHYLTLTSAAYAGAHPERYVCCPPLRDPQTVEALRVRTLSGAIHTIGSDHCCFHGADKARAGHDVRAMPYGMPGVESRLPVMFSEFVHGQGMPLEQFVELTSAAPARLNGLADRKGRLAPGADADLVVWSPDEERAISVTDMHMGMDYDVYDGRVVRGWPRTVITMGRIAMLDGEFSDPGPCGSRLHAQPIFPAIATSRSNRPLVTAGTASASDDPSGRAISPREPHG